MIFPALKRCGLCNFQRTIFTASVFESYTYALVKVSEYWLTQQVTPLISNVGHSSVNLVLRTSKKILVCPNQIPSLRTYLAKVLVIFRSP
jgi:transposase-like protein